MKKFVFLFMLVNCILYPQDGRYIIIQPEKPKYLDIISVKYISDNPLSPLKDSNEITLFAKFVYKDGNSSLCETKMHKDSSSWHGEFMLTDDQAKVILFRFDSGSLIDDNNGDCLRTMVYNEKGEPVVNSHYTLGMLLQYKGLKGFPVKENTALGEAELKLEKKLYPDGEIDKIQKFKRIFEENSSDPETAASIYEEIIKYYRANIKNEDEVIRIVALLRSIKMEKQADRIAGEYLKLHPSGKFAEKERLISVYKEKDQAKRVNLIRELIVNNQKISDYEREQYEYMMTAALIELKRFDEAYEVISGMKIQKANMYNALAWGALEQNMIIDKALEWAKKAVDIARNPDPAGKPVNITMNEWNKDCRIELAFVLDTYAYALCLTGKTGEAEAVYDEMFSIDKSVLSEDYFVRYLECLNKNKKYDKAIKFASQAVKDGKAGEKLLLEFKKAFIAGGGKENEFNSLLSRLK